MKKNEEWISGKVNGWSCGHESPSLSSGKIVSHIRSFSVFPAPFWHESTSQKNNGHWIFPHYMWKVSNSFWNRNYYFWPIKRSCGIWVLLDQVKSLIPQHVSYYSHLWNKRGGWGFQTILILTSLKFSIYNSGFELYTFQFTTQHR